MVMPIFFRIDKSRVYFFGECNAHAQKNGRQESKHIHNILVAETDDERHKTLVRAIQLLVSLYKAKKPCLTLVVLLVVQIEERRTGFPFTDSPRTQRRDSCGLMLLVERTGVKAASKKLDYVVNILYLENIQEIN